MDPMPFPVRPAVFLAIALFLFGAWSSAQAQTGTALILNEVVTDQFPTVNLDAVVLDSSRRHQSGLSSADFTILEDGLPIGLPSVREVVVGTLQVFALNTLREMDLRDPFGLSRFDYVRRALLEQWRTPSASSFGTDELVLLTPDGLLMDGSPSSAYLASILDSVVPSYAQPPSDYDLLFQAVDLALAEGKAEGRSRHVIFITTLPAMGGGELPISTLIAEARASSVSIHAVLVGSADAAASPRSEPLRALARSTGGIFMLFETPGTLAPILEAIRSQRTAYQLTYPSGIHSSGAHTVQLRLADEDEEAASEVLTFNLDLQSPQVAFIRPPLEIHRTRGTPSQPLKALSPTSQALDLLITFPDGHPRPITRLQLLVDDRIALDRSTPPFETIEWDISEYTRSAPHHVRAVVTDTLGMEGSSEEISVGIRVTAATSGILALAPALTPFLIALGILLTGAAMAAVLMTRGVGLGRGLRPRAAAPRLRIDPPLRASLTPRPPARSAEAYLVAANVAEAAFQPVPLTGVDHTLGRDPSIATVIFDDPSVEGMHAKLIRLADGGYLIRDHGSVSGTWVNYEAVPSSGKRLSSGDLIHLGRVGMRFKLSSTQPPREIRIRSLPDTVPLTTDRNGPLERNP
jgi:hypothetical protein